MKKEIILNSLFLGGAVWFAWLFTGEGLGVNALLFASAVIGLVLYRSPDLIRRLPFLAVGAGALLSALTTIWHHSGLAQFIYVLSLMLLVGFAQVRTLRFLWYAFLLAFYSGITAPLNAVRHWIAARKAGGSGLTRWLPMVAIPLTLTGAFFFLYYQASSAFAGYFGRLGEWLEQLMDTLLQTPALGTFVLGLFVVGSILWPVIGADWIARREQQWPLNLVRRKPFLRLFPAGMMGLKKEYVTALISLATLNGLILLANLSDIRSVWLNVHERTAAELSEYVHQGTTVLILAILLAMLVLLFFFRGNINFFRANRPLKWLAYAWLLQNAFMVFSVGIRNYHYLSQYGLTYLRISVFVFLLLVFIGLITVYTKVRERKSVFYLLLSNSWSLYLVLLFATLVNWDVLITRYNLYRAPREHLDVYHLLQEVSDRNLYLLEREKAVLEAHTSYYSPEEIGTELQARRQKILARWQKHSWKSWNYADYRNVNAD